jgi:exopolysaccharide biosynthesis protein
MQIPKIAAAVSALLAVGVIADVQAATISLGSYAGLFQGVSEITANVDGHSAAVVRVDLTAPGISFTTTAPCAGCTPNTGTGSEVVKQTTGNYMLSVGAQVAIDANRYDNNDNQPTATSFSGLGVSNGTLVSPDQSGFAALLISATNQATIVPGGSVSSLNGVQNAIAGTQGTILTNGLNNAVSDNQNANRAGLGLSQDSRYMYLMDASSVTLGEESDLFFALGAWNAINLNGGGSAMLDVANGSGGVSMLNHTTEKYVGPNLAIYAAPLAPVPLPPALLLLGSGLLGLLRVRRHTQG